MSLQSQSIHQYLRVLKRQGRSDGGTVLHYNSAVQDLRPWLWPTQAGVPVAPEKLIDFRTSHEFKAPSCLCASNAAGIDYTESDIYVAVEGEFWGEYVASCATDRCGYLIGLERIYERPDLSTEEYPLRQPPLVADDKPDILRSIQIFERPVRKPETPLDLLLKLDCWVRPGLTQGEVRKLLVQCRCGLSMTRGAFRRHTCAKTVIDLTLMD